MEDDFRIYVDRLREGGEEKISSLLAPDFIGVPEEFKKAVRLFGVAYLTDSHLILKFGVETEAKLDCSICNESLNYKILVEEVYHAIELAKITHLVFNFEDLVRDAILLQLPLTTECGGNCPERKEISKYFSRR